jgi:hypothetical protein
MQRHRIRANNRFITLKLVVSLMLGWLALNSAVIAAPPQQGQDVSFITTPANGATVQGAVQIIGNADHPEFQFYVLEFSPDGSDQWQFVGDGQTPVLNGLLATWNTATVPDGAYLLRLRVVRLDGNFNEAPLQQVIVSNSQPVPTDTPAVIATPADVPPTVTPTAPPPTPTILIEQPIVDTPTPRPIATTAPLEDPDETSSIIPEVSGFSLSGLRDACLYGGGIMLGIFLLFGFLATLRTFVQGFIDRIRRK